MFDEQEKIHVIHTCYICGNPLRLTEDDLADKANSVRIKENERLAVHSFCKKYYVFSGKMPKSKKKVLNAKKEATKVPKAEAKTKTS